MHLTHPFSVLVLALAALPLRAQDEDLAVLESFKRLVNQEALSATRTRLTVSDAPAVLTVFTAQDIEESGARTLADLLKRLPGVQIGDNRANVQMAWFRGVTTTYNEKVLLIIDGVPKRDATLSEWAPDERFDLANVERVEVIRGPGSAVHGGDAYAAVISVYSKPAARDTSYQVAAGNQGTAQTGFRTTVAKGGMEAVFSGRIFKTDGYLSERGLNGTPTDNTNARSARTFETNLTFSPRTRFNLVYGDFDYLYPMHVVLTKRDATYRYTLGSLSHDHGFAGGEFRHQLSFDNTRISFYEVVRYQVPTVVTPAGAPGPFTVPAGTIRQIKDQDKQGMTFGWRSHGVWTWGAHQVLLGADIERKRATYSELEINPYDSNLAKMAYFNSWFSQNGEPAGRNVAKGTNYALIAQDEWALDPKALKLTFGLRWDHYEGFGGQMSPRLGLVSHPWRDGTLKVLWGQAFRPPTFRQLYVVRFDGLQPGDPSLKPELARTLECQAIQTLGRGTQVSLAYFQSTYTDTTLTVANSQWYNSPIPRKISGLELEVRVEFRPGLPWLQSGSIFLNGARLLKAFDATPAGHVDIASVAPTTANAGLTLRSGRFTLFTALNHVGRRNRGLSYSRATGLVTDTYHAAVTVPAYRALDNKGAYTIQDLNLGWKRAFDLPLRLEAGVFNLWDRRHLNPAHDPDTHYDILKERRSVQVKAVLTF